MQFISGFAFLVGFQLVGELIVRSLGFPFPGQVLGMLLLFIALVLNPKMVASANFTATHLLVYLPVFLVPPGVGLMLYLDDVEQLLTPVMTAIVCGVVATLLSTAALMIIVLRFTARWK